MRDQLQRVPVPEGYELVLVKPKKKHRFLRWCGGLAAAIILDRVGMQWRGARRRWFLGQGIALAACLLVLTAGTTACGVDARTGAASSAAPSDQTATPTRSSTPTPSATSSASLGTRADKTPSPAPTLIHRIVRINESIPFAARTIDTATLKKGVVRLKQTGRAGVRTKVFRVTLRDGTEVSRTLVKIVTAKEPVPQIKLRGTWVPRPAPKPKSNCDPNYSGACVPIASDVDCGGGSGNGPAYVYGVVKVVGSDIYDLDRDGDGYGCE